MVIEIRNIKGRKNLFFSSDELSVIEGVGNNYQWLDSPSPNKIKEINESGSPENHTRKRKFSLNEDDLDDRFEQVYDRIDTREAGWRILNGESRVKEVKKKLAEEFREVEGIDDIEFISDFNTSSLGEPYNWIIWIKQKKVRMGGGGDGDKSIYETSENLRKKLKNFVGAEINHDTGSYGIEKLNFARSVPKNLHSVTKYIAFGKDWLKSKYELYNDGLVEERLTPDREGFWIGDSVDSLVESINLDLVENSNLSNQGTNGNEESDDNDEDENKTFKERLKEKINKKSKTIKDLLQSENINISEQELLQAIDEATAKSFFEIWRYDNLSLVFKKQLLKQWIIQNKSRLTNSEPESNQKPNLTPLRTQAKTKIQAALQQDPQIEISELDAQSQDWENKLASLDSETAITDFQNSLVIQIGNLRKTKAEKQQNAENLNTLNDPEATEEQKEEALNDLDKNEGQKSYEEDKDKIKSAKQKLAQNNATKYRTKIIDDLPTKLTKNGVAENELDSPTQTSIQQLRNGEITGPEELVETEMKINQSIGQTGAQKKITNFTQAVNSALQSSDQTKIEQLKTELTEFINSNYIYYQELEVVAQQLLDQLNTQDQTNNPPSSSSNFPYGVVIPLTLLGLVILVGVLFLVKKKKQS